MKFVFIFLALLYVECFCSIFPNLLQRVASILPTNKLIEQAGYPVETHYATTPDGYILGLHRIPPKTPSREPKKVAFLLHGILCSSAHWILFGPKFALGYALSDQGYDVWLGNTRGNTYSRSHVVLDPDEDDAYWQFSWQEMGTVDLPTMIDYILDQTKAENIYYVGHSQGTTAFYVMTSARPEYNRKIKVHVSLAPIGYMKHVTSPLIRILAYFHALLTKGFDLLRLYEFLPAGGIIHAIILEFCSFGNIGPALCSMGTALVCGFNIDDYNKTLVPIIVNHLPSGTSSRQLMHYAQEITSGHFRQYDHYSAEVNLQQYNQSTPPDYDLTKITAPIHLFYSENDWLAGIEDVERLSRELSNLKEMYLIPDRYFNHLNFLFGSKAPELVYKKIIAVFSKY